MRDKRRTETQRGKKQRGKAEGEKAGGKEEERSRKSSGECLGRAGELQLRFGEHLRAKVSGEQKFGDKSSVKAGVCFILFL